MYNQIIQKLSLKDKNLTAVTIPLHKLIQQEVIDLSNALASNRYVKSLNLSSHFIFNPNDNSQEDIFDSYTWLGYLKILAEGIRENISLVKLNLSYCTLFPVHLKAIAKIINDNTSLEELNLSGNFLFSNDMDESDDSLTKFLAAIEISSLKKLDLDSCSLSRNHCVKLIDSLKRNQSLTSVSLWGNAEFDKTRLKAILLRNSPTAASIIAEENDKSFVSVRSYNIAKPYSGTKVDCEKPAEDLVKRFG